MLHKLSIAAVAALLGVAALAPTSASADWHGGGWHAGSGHGGGWHAGGWHGGGWHGGGWYGGPRVYGGPVVSYGYGNCYVRNLVPTPWGPRWRLVNRCY